MAGYSLFFILKVFRLMSVGKKPLIIIGGAVVAVVVTSFFMVGAFFLPFGSDHTPVEMTITTGMAPGQIADTLREQGVVRSSAALILWMRARKMERRVQAGLVRLERGDGVLRASRRLLSATPLEITLMIPEGLTIEQTAKHVSRTIGIDTAEFIALCVDTAFIRKCGIDAPTLEGYLYPDTYRLPEKVSSDRIIMRMTAMHMRIWREMAGDSGGAPTLTHHQLVTLASIVEREATLTSEQAHIAGVFHNRLRLGYPLGADPTVRYALKKFSGPLRVSELNSSSPYNTRRFAGLPPGPICSPGRGALVAALQPLETRDLYFVAKWDGSGAHDFSETNAEHDRKKMEIRRRNQSERKRKAAGVR